MKNDLRAPYLTIDSIEEKAIGFLHKYHNKLSLPIPIEEIIDFDLNISITPLPNLLSAFEVDAYLSSDLKEITVDEGIMMKVPNRYRFSLAHELGHIVMHSDLYRQISFTNTVEFKEFQRSFDPKEYDKIEWQANSFAASILVPTALLIEKFNEGCEVLSKAVGYDDVNLLKDSPNFPEYIGSWLARPERFFVSPHVIIRRLRREGLIDQNYRY